MSGSELHSDLRGVVHGYGSVARAVELLTREPAAQELIRQDVEFTRMMGEPLRLLDGKGGEAEPLLLDLPRRLAARLLTAGTLSHRKRESRRKVEIPRDGAAQNSTEVPVTQTGDSPDY